MTKRHHQPDGRSTIYKGADGLWHGRVSMGLTDQGRKDRRHVSSKSKTVVTEKVAEWERARDDGLAQEIQENWTVEAWLTHWLEHLSRPFVKQSTYGLPRGDQRAPDPRHRPPPASHPEARAP